MPARVDDSSPRDPRSQQFSTRPAQINHSLTTPARNPLRAPALPSGRMASKKQIQANRLNSLKSTGPRSAQGKAVSSGNALKSGIDAKSQIICGEIAADLETLKLEYYGRFQPTAPEQRMLVDTLIDCEWLLRRFRRVESHLWEQGAVECFQPSDDYVLGQAYNRQDGTFAHLQRRIDTAQRTFRITLQELRAIQAEARGTRRTPRKACPTSASRAPARPSNPARTKPQSLKWLRSANHSGSSR